MKKIDFASGRWIGNEYRPPRPSLDHEWIDGEWRLPQPEPEKKVDTDG